MANKIRLGIPKGSLQDATLALFKRAGWNIYATAGQAQFQAYLLGDGLERITPSGTTPLG